MSKTRVQGQHATAIADLPATTPTRLVGIGAVVASSVLFGTNAIFAKLSYDRGMTVFALLWLRYLLPVIVLGPLAVRARRRDPEPLQLRYALLVTIPYLGSSASYLGSISLGPVNQVAPFLYLYPAIIAVIGRAFFGEAIEKRMALAITLGVCGSALLVGFTGGAVEYLPAKVLAIGSATSAAAFYMAGSRLVPERQSLQAVAVTCVVGGLGFLPVVVATHATFALPGVLPYLIVMAIGGTAMGLLLLQVGMRRLGATRASLLSLIEPIVTLSLAFIVLGESTKPVQLLGTLMVLCSFPLARLGRAPQTPPVTELP